MPVLIASDKELKDLAEKDKEEYFKRIEDLWRQVKLASNENIFKIKK